MADFALDSTADTTDIGGMDDIDAVPARVIEVFGPPHSDGDGFKVSGEWVFRGNDGRVYTLSDWKATGLWEAGLPSPADFWAGRAPEELLIQSVEDDVAEFKSWLSSRLTGQAG